MRLDDYLAYKPSRQAKFVIYTAISGDFDDLIQHAYISKDADYICYTDQLVQHPGIWEIRPLQTPHLDRVRSAKYHKMFPNELFPTVQFSVWIDGNMDVLNAALEHRVDDLMASNTLLATNVHFERNCAYEEALACCWYQLDDVRVISNQVKYLNQQGFPHDYGLFETNMMVRDHHHPLNIALMQSWWGMIVRFSRRDQISFTYVLYQHQMTCAKLFPRNPRFGHDFIYKGHNKKLKSQLYIDTGDGFHPGQIVVAECFVSQGKVFNLVFDVTPYAGIRRLRFDPIENEFCRLSIESVHSTGAMTNDSIPPQLPDASSCSEDVFRNDFYNYVHNGVQVHDGYIDFETFDPQVTWLVTADIRRFVIKGQIQWHQAHEKITALVQKIQVASAENIAMTSTLAELHLAHQHALQAVTEPMQSTITGLQRLIDQIHASSTWRLGKALLWLPKVLFKRG